VWTYADRSGTDADTLSAQTFDTRYGPLTPLDQEFLTKVRLAGLWELPAGEQAEHKGTTPAVRTAGEHLVEGHTLLDARVRDVARHLGVVLPDQPTAQQREWLDTLDASHGQAYDRDFATLLRQAHGTVYPLIAQVRVSTRNVLVRDLAEDAGTTVLDHIKVLEATGYVDFDALTRDTSAASAPPGDVVPLSPAPPATVTSSAPSTSSAP
jgi:predicted outer membrane protein